MPKLKPTDIEPTSEEDAAIRAGIALDHDTWELTADDLARMKPASELIPHNVERAARRRGRQKAPTKERITIRVDADIAVHFRATDPGWQTRLNDTLRQAIARGSNRPAK